MNAPVSLSACSPIPGLDSALKQLRRLMDEGHDCPTCKRAFASVEEKRHSLELLDAEASVLRALSALILCPLRPWSCCHA